MMTLFKDEVANCSKLLLSNWKSSIIVICISSRWDVETICRSRTQLSPRIKFSEVTDVWWGHVVLKRWKWAILYCSRCRTGSHCSSRNIGVIWSRFEHFDTMWAVEFCTHWSLEIWQSGRALTRLLQLSSLDDTNVWIRGSVDSDPSIY